MSLYDSAPPTQNGYSLYMSRSLDDRDMFGIPSAFREFFTVGPVEYATDSSAFTVDIIRGNQKTSLLVRRNQQIQRGHNLEDKMVEDGKYTNISRQFPLSEDKGVITATQLLMRQAGENPFSPSMRIERLRRKAEGIHAEIMRRQSRLCEYLAAYVMQNAKQPYFIGDSTDVIDFKRNASNTVACSNTWDSGSGTPLDDLASACGKAKLYSGVTPDMLVLDTYSSAALFTETNFKAFANIIGYSFISAGDRPDASFPPYMQKFVDGGFIYIGRLMTPEGYRLWCFVSQDTYDNASGTATPYMTAKTAFVANSRSQFNMLVGPPEMMPPTQSDIMLYNDYFGISSDMSGVPTSNMSVMPAGMFYHDAYMGQDRKYAVLRTQSAVVFVPRHIDTVCTLTNCAT